MPKARITQSEISDILIERPISFTFRGKRLKLYPPSLGKVQLISRLWGEINPEGARGANNLQFFTTILSTVKEKRKECVRLLAYMTLRGADCLDENAVYKRIKELRGIDIPDLASLVLTAVSMDKTGTIERHYGIDKETERMRKVVACKDKSSGSVSFGGKSVWGTLIDAACERYGWSYQYVLWGISYTNLQLLLDDQVRSVFLSDEERKRAARYITGDSDVVRVSDKDALMHLIKSENWD